MNKKDIKQIIETISDYYYILRKGSTVKKLSGVNKKNLADRIYKVISKDLGCNND